MHVYPRNASGLTYGSAELATTPDNEPDLILVVATNGKQGYVKQSQLEPATAANPAAAVAAQKAHTAAGHAPKIIPVYAEDGTTVIGEFELSAVSAN